MALTTINRPDDQKALFGTGNDLEIYHDGTDSFIINNTGTLQLNNDDIRLKTSGAETMVRAVANGAVEIMYDNSTKFETTTTGIKVTGDGSDALGAVLNLVHGNNNSTDVISSVVFSNTGGEQARIQAETTGANTTGLIKFYTDNAGTSGERLVILNDGKVRVPDSGKFVAGDDNDLEIYHTGTGAYIQNKTGTLYIGSNFDDDDGGDIRIQPKYGENSIVALDDGAVELYYDNVKKFETTSLGATVTGDLFLDNTSNAGRDVHWDASGDCLKFDDWTVAVFGTDDDLKIYHSGSHGYIENGTGELLIRAKTSENSINCNPDGSVELYYDNVKVFETYSEGVQILGGEGVSAVLQLLADEGDDNADHWELRSNQDESDFEIRSKAQGSYTAYFKLFSYGPMYHTSYSNSYSSLTLKKGDANGAAADYIQCRDESNNLDMVVEPDGDLKNANNTYGQTSDVKLKENIVDANSQWDDIKAIKVRNWNFKESTGLPTHRQIGVVAQEIETVSAGLVSESIDRDPDTGTDLGTKTKSVKYSILYMKAIKALQEAMAKIETLETKVAALEGG